MSEALLTEVLRIGDDELAVHAHELLACSTFHQGAAVRSVGHAEQGLRLYDEERDSSYLAPYGEHPAVSCHDWAALALWFLGRPDSALAHARQARDLAETHPYSLASAEVQLAYLHHYRDEPAEVLRWAEQAAVTAGEHGFPIRAAQADILGGWAQAAAGGDGDGVGRLRDGLATYLATGAELDHPFYLGLLGHALGATGAAGDGLAAVEQAIALAGTARPFYYLPELHRLRGDLLAAGGHPGAAAAAYGRAMELAAAYGARSPELRAALRLCLLPPEARPEDADGRLRRLYDRFEEGFDTPDLRVAVRLSGAAGTS